MLAQVSDGGRQLGRTLQTRDQGDCTRRPQDVAQGVPDRDGPRSCYGSKMGFSDEARKLAQQEQAEQQARDEQDPRKPFMERTERVLGIRDERRRSDCRKKVGKWFDRVGMSPHPPHSIGEVGRRPIPYSNSLECFECIEITWEFDGYKYRAACTEDSKSLPTVEIYIKGYWLPAGDTKIAIGRAILEEEQPYPGSAWGSAAMKSARPSPPRDTPPPPVVGNA